MDIKIEPELVEGITNYQHKNEFDDDVKCNIKANVDEDEKGNDSTTAANITLIKQEMNEFSSNYDALINIKHEEIDIKEETVADITSPNVVNFNQKEGFHKMPEKTNDTVFYLKRRERFDCPTCSRVFHSHSRFKVHLIIHTEERPFNCNLCSYKALAKDQLAKHVLTHTEEKPYSCDICGYKCRRKRDMKKHLTIHTGKKRFCCTSCDYQTNNKSQLNRHLKTHTTASCGKIKPEEEDELVTGLEVKLEQREFVENDNSTGERPYNCNFCSYKAFVKDQLARHVMIHTGEKPYSCYICDYKCRRKADMTMHLTIHTGKKRYGCTSCDYETNNKSQLIQHLKTHATATCGKIRMRMIY